ncbi:MAG: hypothetical protein NZ480_08915 [Bdellovibrionaceae bacterium]|nr:hypothetical protein [Pseudobdellovibrionaceae bacterium]MDW8189408.1 hypothetical protein [Pseudobdellovibrionaceae bacterium]
MSATIEKKIQKMEALLLHSVCGFHVLFHNHQIRQALNTLEHVLTKKNISETKKQMEDLIRDLVNCSSLSEKLGYLNNLDQESRALLVHAYFEIIENALKQIHPHKNIH